MSEKVLGLEDLKIEVEYQGETIGKFGLDFDGVNFLLTTKQTDCLARESCGIPEFESETSSCEPGGTCC